MQKEGTTAKSLRKEMRFPVNLTSQRHYIIEKLMNLAGRLSQGKWQIVSSQTVDALHIEIYQLEKTLANAPTRPTRTVRNSRPLEPITEQQKIVDLAG
jgi:hypothetical protein